MKSIELFLAEIEARGSLIPAAPTRSPNRAKHLPELAREVVDSAARGWRLFRIDATSRFASDAVVRARIGKATNDIDELALELGESPDCNKYNVGLVTGEASGVFVVEMVCAHGFASFTPCIEAAVLCQESDGYEWRTLTSRGGGSTFAFLRYPTGLTSKARKRLEFGVTIHGEGGYILIPPSTSHTYLNDLPVRVAPQGLINLAFEVPSGGSTPPAPCIPPQAANSGCRPVSNRYGAADRRPNITRERYPEYSVGALRGKFHSSPRN